MRAAAVFVCLLSTTAAAWGIGYQLLLSSSAPQNDIVDFYNQFLTVGGFDGFGLAELYQRHNEHRLFLPKLWFLLDIAVVDARQTLLLTVISISAVAHAALIAVLFRGTGQTRTASVIAFLVGVGAMLSPIQWENLLQGFQVQFIQVWLFATLAFALIAWAPIGAPDGRGRSSLVAAAVIGAAIAGLGSTYSMINGLAVWPLLVIFAVWRRMPVPWILFLALLGGAVLAVEVSSFLTRPGGGNMPGLAADPWTVVRFMARYLTSAVDDIGSTGQEILGLAAMTGVVAAGVVALVRPAGTPPARMALLAACAFLLGAAVTTALGRLHIGLGAANASRYATPSMVFLVIVGLLAYDALSRVGRARPRARRILPWATAIGVLLLLVPGLVHEARNLFNRFVARDFVRMAVVSHLAGGYRPDTLYFLYPHWPPRPDSVLQGMQREGLGPFSELARFMPPAAALVDGPAVDAPACEGVVQHLRIDPVNGVTFASWLAEAGTGVRPPWVVARAEDGRVVAWGADLEARADRAPILEPGIVGRGHVAFGPVPDAPVAAISVEGVFDDGRRCRLAGTIAMTQPARYAIDPPLGPSAAVGSWIFEGSPLTGQTGSAEAPTGAEPLFGSMGLHDRRFKTAIELGDPQGAAAVAVPLLTETRPFGTTISLERADGTVVDAEVLERPSTDRWVWLILRSDALDPGMRLTIRTVEAHPLNGLAFGTPHWLP